MTRADYIKGAIERERNVIQKMERVAEARRSLDDVITARRPAFEAQAKLAYECANSDLDAALHEKFSWFADYVEANGIEDLAPMPAPAVGRDFDRVLGKMSAERRLAAEHGVNLELSPHSSATRDLRTSAESSPLPLVKNEMTRMGEGSSDHQSDSLGDPEE